MEKEKKNEEALVLCSMGNRCLVTPFQGSPYVAYLKGNVRLEGIRSTSPVVVGDRVEISFSRDRHQTAMIEKILPRRNYLIRRATNLSRESQILAANIDQALLLVTLASPVTTTTFIDRFLATAEAYSVPVSLLFNKIDLYNEEERIELNRLSSIYESIGYPIFYLSATTGGGCEAIKVLLKDKITLLTGHSGVGKSTLTNQLIAGTLRETQPLNEMYGTGRHTTTLAEMIPLGSTPQEGYLIDSPGIKGFGTIEMDETNLGHYFREFFEISKQCRFYNCRHLNEPNCAVINAVEEGKIALSRYKSYLSILEDSEAGKYRPPQ